MNELLWIALLFANFILITLAYKLFGKRGLYMWIPIATIIANIQVIQTIELFGFTATLGNIVYATSFLVTDILSENYGKEDAKQGVWIGFYSLVSMTLIMKIAVLFQPAQEEFAQKTYESLTTIFNFMPRLVIASLLAYLASQRYDIWAYHFLRQKFEGKKRIWIRNNLSTMVSQLLDSVIFSVIAFAGVYSFPVLLEIIFTTYVLKWLVAAADTPFVYIGSVIYQRQKDKKTKFNYI